MNLYWVDIKILVSLNHKGIFHFLSLKMITTWFAKLILSQIQATLTLWRTKVIQ